MVITNSTAYDQAFIENRNIYDNISNIVDGIFNEFIRRQGVKEPYYAEYCNGSTVTCPGMSQWGTVTLANQGMNPLQILKYYYPDDIQVIETNNIISNPSSYPGYPLSEGMTSEDIRRMQNYLNRIRADFPAISQISNPNGYYGPDTTAAIRKFQRIFGLPSDGITGKVTWYNISSIYSGVAKLAELTSEGERIGIGESPPTSTLRVGSDGADVILLQFIVNYISRFYSTVPFVIQDGTYGTETRNAVMAFQRTFGINPDGIVGPVVWNKLFQVYRQIENNLEVPGTNSPPPNTGTGYPGTPLKVGSQGSNVLLMQRYLNSIANRYPSIPKIQEDGEFGPASENAVMAYQRQFGLTVDGIIGPITWNSIVNNYNNSTVQPPERPPYPGYLVGLGSRGNHVLLMQQYLTSIADRYAAIPKMEADGIFGAGTQ
ncbi:MAG: peptidoglycan-binding protein, partial [Lachnoclostridium sp.]|nr:peptidoglycan-binding protein [Lachnoclostridium sp.]